MNLLPGELTLNIDKKFTCKKVKCEFSKEEKRRTIFTGC